MVSLNDAVLLLFATALLRKIPLQKPTEQFRTCLIHANTSFHVDLAQIPPLSLNSSYSIVANVTHSLPKYFYLH